MLSIEEAFATYASRISPLESEVIPTAEALHRTLRADAPSAVDLPPFTQSAMDGYAARGADIQPGTELPIAMTLAAAGVDAVPTLPAGVCARIFTGGPVPMGADTVIMQEQVERDGDVARFELAPRIGQNVRKQAEEISVGQTVCAAGGEVTPGKIGALCAAGVATVSVTRVPRVTLLVTGDEIVPPGTVLKPGQVYDCNTPMVAAWLRRRGIIAEVARLPDNAEETRQGVSAALDASDLVLTTGGVSVGEKDFVIGAARASGVADGFWKVAQKPGKPLYFGTREDCVFLGLPGNPAAVFVGLSVHVTRILDLLAGRPNAGQMRTGTTSVALRRSPDRAIWHRASVDFRADGAVLSPLQGQASHMLGNLSECTALALIPPGDTPLSAGTPLEWLPV